LETFQKIGFFLKFIAVNYRNLWSYKQVVLSLFFQL